MATEESHTALVTKLHASTQRTQLNVRLRRYRPLLVAICSSCVAGLLFFTFFFFLPQHMVPRRGLSEADRLKARNDIRTTGIQAVGGLIILIAAGIGAYFTRKQLQVSREGQVTDRLTKAIEQLGSDRLDIRLGGIYALERIALASKEDHRPIMEIFVTILGERLPWPPVLPGQYRENAPWNAITPLRTRAADLQAIVTVLSRRNLEFDSPDRLLNLHSIDLRKSHLVNGHIGHCDFTDTHFSGSNLNGTDFRGSWFVGAALDNTFLRKASLKHTLSGMANFDGADMTGADLSEASLSGASFVRTVLTNAALARCRLCAVTEEPPFRHSADLSQAIGLTSEQFEEAIFDDTTPLPRFISDARPAESQVLPEPPRVPPNLA